MRSVHLRLWADGVYLHGHHTVVVSTIYPVVRQKEAAVRDSYFANIERKLKCHGILALFASRVNSDRSGP